MVDFRTAFSQINQRFGWVSQYVAAPAYSQLPTALQREVAEIITDLVMKFMRPTLAGYILAPVRLKDGSVVKGQSAFDRMVREDKDVLALVERYRPSYLWYLDRAKKVKAYIDWSDERFVDEVEGFLGENGVQVGRAGREYLLRVMERFRRRIYG